MALHTFVAGDVLEAQQLNDSFAAVGGLRVVKVDTAFTAVSSVTVDNVFSATYRNYKILISYTTSAVASIGFRVRTGGSSISTTTYNLQRLTADSTSLSATRSSSQTSFTAFVTSANVAAAEMTIYEPFIATPTNFTVFTALNDSAYTAPEMVFRSGNNSNSTSYDGFELFVSSGTMTGTYAVYGLALT
jgi:hypothetical protein